MGDAHFFYAVHDFSKGAVNDDVAFIPLSLVFEIN